MAQPRQGSSLPVRERGSKLAWAVTSLAGGLVAPRAGAWIETRCCLRSSPGSWSLPVRERGSKPLRSTSARRLRSRSPCGSVDRNAATAVMFSDVTASLPVRERGSKPSNCRAPYERSWSLPVRERGSKRARSGCSAALRASRSPCGSVDRNDYINRLKALAFGRSPCGSVDRNKIICSWLDCEDVAPRAGAWIETPQAFLSASTRLVAPRAGAWIETFWDSGFRSHG